jgi:hypothetical protein
MVRAIREGRKTMTRRVLFPQLPTGSVATVRETDVLVEKWPRADREFANFGRCDNLPLHYAPGDHLWVRETWATSVACDNRKPTGMERPGMGYGWPVWYFADDSINLRGHKELLGGPGFTGKGRKRVSIHMPRWASRIVLEITSVRVERLQAITERDADAEGTTCHYHCTEPTHEVDGLHRCRPVHDYELVWDKINAKRGFGWSVNPWVWVVAFKDISNDQAHTPPT